MRYIITALVSLIVGAGIGAYLYRRYAGVVVAKLQAEAGKLKAKGGPGDGGNTNNEA